MRKISVSDLSVSDAGRQEALTFRHKVEISRLLDRIGVDTIETGVLSGARQDCILVKTLASTLRSASLCVGVDICGCEAIDDLWKAASASKSPRLQVISPVSAVQMEYLCHRKPAAILDLIKASVAKCASLCPDVEFVAGDFTRSDADFLSNSIQAAVQAGASRITLYDEAGDLLPDEFHDAVMTVRNFLTSNIKLGVRCSNAMFLADSCALSAVSAGADEVKTSASDNTTTSLKRFCGIISIKGGRYGLCTSIKMTDLQMALSHIRQMTEGSGQKANSAISVSAESTESYAIKAGESREGIARDVASLGYDISDEDLDRVYEAFARLAAKNGEVQLKELDAIVASEAFQAPKTFSLENYVINSSNIMSSTCHLRLRKGENRETLECVCCGGGPVDAAFHAIEQLVDRQYELDDFQIRSVTEGRESLGEAIVRLRSNGKVFSGRGISSDIVGSSIEACLSAVNKIVFDENEQKEDDR